MSCIYTRVSSNELTSQSDSASLYKYLFITYLEWKNELQFLGDIEY